MKKKGGWLAQRREREVEESPQRVVVTRWGLLDPASRVGGPQRVTTTRWGLLDPASKVEGGRKPPTSRNDSLVVGCLVVAVVLIVRSYPIKIVVQL